MEHQPIPSVTSSTSTSAASASRQQTRAAQPPVAERQRTDAELRDIMKMLMDNPDSVNDISDEDVIALKQRINPLNTFIPANKSYAVASIVNMKESDMRNFLMTSLIGFVYRRLSEYTPDFVTKMRESYERKINQITTGDDIQGRRDKLREEGIRVTQEYETAHRDVARAFLDSIFLFNPDKHVRRAHLDAPVDAIDILTGRASATTDTSTLETATSTTTASTTETSSTKPKADAQATPTSISRAALAEATAIVAREVATYRDGPHAVPDSLAVAEAADAVYRGARIASGNIAQGYRILSEELANMSTSVAVTTTTATSGQQHQLAHQLEDARQLLLTCRERVDRAATIVGPYACGHTELDVADTLRVNPPADTFYHFGRYIDANYEALRVITDAVYQTPPDIENMVIYYESFPTAEEAREFIHVHEAEFHADPKIIENGGATLLGPFRENRQTVDFYNRHTEVLRQMSEQITRDQQIGADITKKRVNAAKRANFRETGPDDAAGLDRYLSARGIISQFGQRPELTREEREKLARAEQDRAEYEAPEGTLVTRVLRPVLNEDGMPVDLQQSFFYTDSANVPAGSGASGSAPGTGSSHAPAPSAH